MKKSTKPNYLHLLNRVCSAPLAIEPRNLAPILDYLGVRMGVEMAFPAEMEAIAQQGKESFPTIPENFAIVDVSGPLVRKATGMEALCGLSSYEQIEREYVEAMDDTSKQAILMVYDSPGGEVGGLFDLTDLIYASRGKKPVYAAIAESAFSAAYALASACDKIYITRTAGAGSIGVFTAHCDRSGMDKQAGLSFTYIFAGSKKVDGNPHEPLSADAAATIQAEVDRTYDLFVKTVARNRKLTPRKVQNTEAGLFFGAEAVDIGLADEVGTVSEAFAAMQQEAMSAKAGARFGLSGQAKEPAIAPVEIQPAAGVAAIERGASLPEQAPVADASAPNLHKEANMAEPKAADASAPETIEEKTAPPVEPKKAKRVSAPPVAPEDDGEVEPDEDDAKKASSVAMAADPKEVIFLCGLAKRPEAVSDFISRDLTIAQVREELVKGEVAKERASGAIAHFVPASAGHLPADKLDSLAKARAASTGKPFAKAYAEVLRENPTLYVDYLNQKDAALGVRR